MADLVTVLDFDDAVRLLAAVARQWMDDAQRDEHEQALLAQWLGVTPEALCRRLEPQRPKPSAWPRCPGCGAPLPEHNHGTRGRRRVWCSERCRTTARTAAKLGGC